MPLHVEFFTDAVENPAKTEELGRPIYEDREFVRIKFPGDNKREHVAPAHEIHYVQEARAQMTYAEQYPQHYEVFKSGKADQVIGTPLDELTFLTAAQRSEMRALNVHTAEQLAALGDREINKFGPGFRDLKEKAAAYLDKATGNADVIELQRQVAELKAQLQGGKPEPVEDQFKDFSDEDLKNMIRDAGKSLPRGNAGRAKLIEALMGEADAA